MNDTGEICKQDYQQAQAFVATLTGDVNTVMDFRCINETDRTVPGIPRRGTLAEHWYELCHWNSQGYGIYCVIAETDGLGKRLENVTRLRAHYIDLDGIDAVQQLEAAKAFNPAPSFAVQSSPGKYHVYWLIEPHNDRDRFTLVQRKLVTRFNSDPSIIDIARILRLPGTLHMKNPASPTLVSCFQLAGFGTRASTGVLEVALWGVEPAHGGALDSPRTPVGRGERAPSTADAIAMLNRIDVTTVTDRNQWIAITGAFIQSVAPEDLNHAYQVFQHWNLPYPGNDPAANVKVWNDIVQNGTTVKGWPRLHKEATGLTPQQARLMPVGQGGGQTLNGEIIANEPDFLTTHNIDGGQTATTAVCMKYINGFEFPIKFNEFSQRTMVLGRLHWANKRDDYPREWTDADTVGCKAFLETHYIKPSKETVSDSIDFIARRNPYHPVNDYLQTLQWDGVPRLQNLLPRYFSTEDSLYTRTVGLKFMISAVARVMKPGCKVDTVLILEGQQGTYKSQSISALCGEEWFSDELPDLHSKEPAIYLVGKWIVEISELSAFNKSDVETIKKFLSKPVDRYRPVYGRRAVDQPRQSVFIATTNDEHYLKDQTGNRRFWPVKCGQINIEAIRQDRDQLWAEAVTMFKAGETWWLNDAEADLARSETDDRREIDPWEDAISRYLAVIGDAPVCIQQICMFAIMIPFDKQNAQTNKRIASCLRNCGYSRRRITDAGSQRWVYVRDR